MDGAVLREVEVKLLSALLKGTGVAGHLVKAGFRPDLLPSPEGRDLARLILRLRDARGDVTEGVEAQAADASSLGAEGAGLLDLARDTPCPDREQALAYLAALELSETSERLRATAARAEDLLGPSRPPGNSQADTPSPRGTSPRQVRRVRMLDPRLPIPSKTPDPRKPEND